jgi:hypothetical protein
MAFRRVFLILLLHQAVMGWIQYSSIYCQMRVGSYGYVPSCQASMVTASRGLGSAMLILLREALGAFHRGPRFPPWVDGRGWMDSQVVKF